MKKSIVIFALIIFGAVTRSNAQTVVMEDVLISSIKLNEGANTVLVPGNKGTFKVVKRGASFTGGVFVGVTGKSTTLKSIPAMPASPNNGAEPAFNIKANGDGTYLIGLLLPAVQKVREAAARMKQ